MTSQQMSYFSITITSHHHNVQEKCFFELEQMLCRKDVVRMTWHFDMILGHECGENRKFDMNFLELFMNFRKNGTSLHR